MPKPLSIDLRERVLAAVAGGRSRRAAAERFGVAPSTAIKWVATWRANGRDRPLSAGGDRRSHPIETHAEAILAWLAETPDVTLAEVTADLARQRGLQVSRSTVWRFFARRAITFKKKTAHACEQERPDVARRRQAWRAGQPDLDPAQLVLSSMRPGRRPRWHGGQGAPARGTLPGTGPARALADDDVRWSPAGGRDDGAHGAGRPHAWPSLPDLGRTAAGPHTPAR